MQFSTITTFLSAALAVSAAPTASSSIGTSIEARGGNSVFIGHTGASPISKITWQSGDDICLGHFLTLGAGKDFNPCDIGFEQNGQHLVYKQCGVSSPELWTVDGNGALQNKISTCNYVGKDHGCSIWEWPSTVEWQCDFPQ